MTRFADIPVRDRADPSEAHGRRVLHAERARELFLLEPGLVFLNHGSYGACPRPVFEEYQRLQRELERNPVAFLGRDRRWPDLIAAATAELAAFVGADPADLVPVANATTGMNIVARSLRLRAGDEVLVSDHEYGAVQILWRMVCQRAAARFVPCPIPVPLHDPQQALDAVLARVTPQTRAVVFSHITSPTALVLPVAELCRELRAQRVLSIVDGAHAPGQVPVDVQAIGADFYAGNCHKWLSAPKGAGFLHARREHHSWLEPLVLSWDAEAATLAERHGWQGTRDPSALLTVPAAIRFQDEHDWGQVRARCHALADGVRLALAELTGLEPLTGPDGFVQMVAAPLPPCDPVAVERELREGYRIEIPVRAWNGRVLIRVSVQAYNGEADIDALLGALVRVL